MVFEAAVFPDAKPAPTSNTAIAAPVQTVNVNVAPPSIPSSPTIHDSKPADKPKKKPPNIVCSRRRTCAIGFDEDIGTCHESFTVAGPMGVIATFYNALPSSGEQIHGALNVKARMKFYHSDKIELAEETAFGTWFESNTNSVELWPEESQDLVVAVAKGTAGIFLLEDKRPNPLRAEFPPRELNGKSFDVKVRLTFQDESGNTMAREFDFVIELNSDDDIKQPPIQLKMGRRR